MIEREGSNFFNVAAVIGHNRIDRYRQKNPATTSKGRTLPILPGDYRKIMLSEQWSMGLMICNDYFSAATFFDKYEQCGVNAVVLIADSASPRSWLETFPQLCKKHRLMAIVCNAAGPGGGCSCIISDTGQFVLLRTLPAQYPTKYLSDAPSVAFASV
jgi:predicted amidohydrolase